MPEMIETCPYEVPTEKNVASWAGFLYFVWEREAIRIARENGYDKPWTIDPIMAKYKFCNIHRRDDRVSRWLLNNIYSEFFCTDDVWLVAAICRLINWPPTLLELKKWDAIPPLAFEFQADKFECVIDEFADRNPKAYTGAYMIYPGRQTGVRKSEFLAYHVIEPMTQRKEAIRSAVLSNSVENTVEELAQCYGINTFIAGQIAADLTYIEGQLDEAEDLYHFAPLGPGSQQGLSVLHGENLSYSWRQGEFNRQLRIARDYIADKLGITDLTLHDVQNCFCEYGKYAKAVLGIIKPRNIYKPETQF